jgi:competence protein ComFC
VARKIIVLAKFKERFFLSLLLAKKLHENYKELFPANTEWDVVVAAPPNRKHHFSRSFNFTSTLASVISKKDKLPLINPRIKSGPLTPRSLLGWGERIKDFKMSYHVKPSYILNKRLLIIEDVVTTGRTVYKLAETLTTYQPQSIDLISLARSQRWSQAQALVRGNLYGKNRRIV